MPFRSISVDGTEWRVRPAGHVTANARDEFSLIFERGQGQSRELRSVRYSPQGARSPEVSLAELSDTQLLDLLRQSQPSATSPELFYAR